MDAQRMVLRKDSMETMQLDSLTDQQQNVSLAIEEHRGTYFYDTDGNRLGSEVGIVPITLFKGMKMTICDHDGEYRVVDWNYHLGYKFEEAGLRIVLEMKV